MSRVENRVKHWRSQPIFDREILDKLTVTELEFLCRLYHNRVINHKKSIKSNSSVIVKNKQLTLLKKLQQRYKQLCEEINVRRGNLLASPTFYMTCYNNFDVDTGNVYDVDTGIIAKNVSFNRKENGYVVTYNTDY
jgi:hypothetical protein